ncbi:MULTISPECIES: hypothetical protein [Mesorhizobium]|uniref:hypothetical protein n=1 Tax=Mesorhizobium TaxID=68287 RepID=UPI0007A95067|nr:MULTISPECIES: hypothetical protein [Mesorhizobium]AMX93688.1 hypothetical protein A4R28_11550 [Mesorhizobium ciceri]MDF3208385.1 hypothetical protein [Mesorhizobium sp. LMG15046]MDF3229044.1 hypothetical protein [Mesorhizobium sp. DSM 30133]RUU22159.1 hypothetical protein EOC84_03345 [Mesorhizobium sp. Primo-B]RUU37931.1 hypothetical protein EOC83_16870 [Mesorhizobium sp. Primo-A]
MTRWDEVLIFVRGKWEIAHKEVADGARQMWIRRDMSWICDEGAEEATLPMPPKPKKAKPT